jgi:prevent-host-death family protein
MAKRVSATSAKNNFGGLLEDVAAFGRVDVVRHGRVVAVVLSVRAFEASLAAGLGGAQDRKWGETHMIPVEFARGAHVLNRPSTFDEE